MPLARQRRRTYSEAMTGARHAAAHSGGGALKSALWLLRMAAALIAAAVAILSLPALVAGLVYLAVASTNTEAWVASGLAGVLLLGSALAERGRGLAYRAWIAAALIVNATGLLLGALGRQDGRAAGQAHTMSLVGGVLGNTGTACACIALLYLLRTSALPWLRRRRAASPAE